jgi:tRNA dimethylallyltransferase
MTPPDAIAADADGRWPVLCVMGPTATGKTDLAVRVAERLPVEVISVDSALVYRGLDIGAAKPSPELRARVPHALVDIRDPAEPYTAAEFRADALAAMVGARARGRLPLLVGGTMLYFRVLEQGIAEMPETDPALRDELGARAEREGLAALHAELARVDPVAAERIHPNNPQRLKRALEVHAASGRPISAFWAEGGDGEDLRRDFALRRLALVPDDRSALHAAIAERFDAMLAAGLVEEVRALRARGDLHPGLPAIRAVGYRQAWAHLDGEVDLAGLRERGIAATRQLARRQLTWLRRWPELTVHPVTPGTPPGEAALATALSLSAPDRA